MSGIIKLNLPSVEEYHKRKVALITGMVNLVFKSKILICDRYHWTGWIVSVSSSRVVR